MAEETVEKKDEQATGATTEERGYQEEYESALAEGETPAEQPKQDEQPFDKEAFAKEIREQVKKEYEPLIESRVNKLAEENRLLKEAQGKLTKDVQDMKPPEKDPLDLAFEAITSKIDDLPEEERVFYSDPHFLSVMKRMLGGVISQYAPQKAEAPAAPQLPEMTEEQKAKSKELADSIQAEVIKTHADANDVYASKEFWEWYRPRARYKEYQGRIIPEIYSPDPQDHVSIIGQYKDHRKALAAAEAEKAEAERKAAALAGHGQTRGGAATTGKPGLTDDDILDMSPDEFRKFKQNGFKT